MEFISSDKVKNLLASYPQEAADKLSKLRQLILDTAEETEGVNKLVETTKWGEPSYVTKNGSTIRMDWKSRSPDKYYLYFICSTQLISTFRMMFGEELSFEGNRAIELDMNEPIPIAQLRQCISIALKYHKVKNLPLLG
ncbi:MAG: DUF1801 domain-containing protein [Cyclobacteriaceae bacterium]